MGLTSSLYTGLSGLNANQARIDTIGNNIANVNTTAFKASRSLFQTQFYQTVSIGSSPSATSGGTNPMQYGRGVLVGSTRKNFGDGPTETTGIVSDLAIEGDGFFLLQTLDGAQVYTRDGSFTLDAEDRLVSAQGYRVQGYGVDADYNIDPTTLTDIVIPLGTETVARATENILLDGDLSAAGTISTTSSETRTQQLFTAGGGVATGATALTNLRGSNGAVSPLFNVGDTITLSGITKGDRELPTETFIVGTTGSTLDDLAAWMEDVLGIQNAAGLPGNPGVTIENGAVVVRGNAGEQNSVEISSNDISTSNETTPLPFQFTQVSESNGSGVFTGFTVYDSLGTASQVYVTFALEETTNLGPVWRFYVESPDSNGETRALGTGTIAFDTEGNVRETTGTQLSLDLSDTGAGTPLTFNIDFGSLNGLSTATSSVIMSEQDGYPPGTLNGYAIDNEGQVIGTFSNGLSRTLGQVAVAVFGNPEGLVAESQNIYTAGPNSGAVALTTGGQNGAGLVRSGALEASNVDLGNEFIGLVTASTGFQAASRVISVSSDMLNQLLLIVR